MPKQTLFTARGRSEHVVGQSGERDDATATGAFVISADARRLAYDFSWDGLSDANVVGIDLHHYGKGKDGPSVWVLCGKTAKPCPKRRGGTLRGEWNIDPKLVHELANRRLYVDVHTASEPKGELRGQIEPLPWMLHSQQFVVRTAPPNRREINGTGTFYVTAFPQHTQVTFDLTIAGLPDGKADIEIAPGGAPTRAIARIDIDARAVERRGGTLSGTLTSGRGPHALTPRLLDAIASGEATITVRVAGRAAASGQLEPVR